MNEKTVHIYGKYAVRDACTFHPKAVKSVSLADSVDAETRKIVQALGIRIERFDGKRLPQGVSPDAVHQGCIASVDLGTLTKGYDAFIKSYPVTPHTAFVLLGEVQDPHNVGAIIRSAAAFGISAVLLPEHRQAQITGSVVKASAGMAFRVPLVSIGNVNHTISDLKKRGFWVYGLDGDATHKVADEGFEKASVFILGNEGLGIREKTLEHCDITLQIPISKETESLNASVAAAIVCYEWSKKHLRN